MVVFHEGDNVRAKFMATKMGPFGTKFLPGVISKVHPDPGKKDDNYRYDINYENGKFEANVKAQFVKEPLAEAAGAVAPTPRPELAPEAKQLEPKSVHKEVKPVAPQATPAAKPEPKSAQKASAGPTDDSGSKRESKLSKASPDGSDAELAAKPSKASASAAASGRPEASASGSGSGSASSNKRVRKQVDYNAAEQSSEDESSEEDAAASKSARASASKGKASKPKKVMAESESEEYEEPSSEGSADEESEAEAESEPEEVPKKKPAKAAPKPAARKPAAKKAVAKAVAPGRKTKKPASPEADSASEEGSDEEEDEDEDEDDDAFDEGKAPVKKAAKARGATKPKGGSSYEKIKWSEEEIAELPVLTKPQEMFDDMVAQAEARASTKGSALEGHSLAALAQRLDGRKLRVATM
jgi:hypothetical protein